MIAFALFLGIVGFLFMRLWLQRRKLPPGPFPLPLLGNLHQLVYIMLIRKKNFVEAITEFSKEDGSVHTFWFGPMPTVNICDYATAVDAMVKKGSAFADRNIPYLLKLTRGDRGIVATNGLPWLEQRRFALHTLRNFGLGRNIVEERIMYEFEIACEELERRLDGGEAYFDPDRKFDLLVGNIINRMMFTDRFEKPHGKDSGKARNQNVGVINMSNEEPICGKIKKEDIADGKHMVEGEGADFVDAFLVQMKKEQGNNSFSTFDEEWLLMSLFDIWSAGQETTKITLNWAFSYLLLYPQVKSRIEEESLSITKHQRPLSIKDRPNTPYYNAVLNEVHRCALILPMNSWRDTAEDTVVGSYLIPKGTAITAQISAIMTDEKYFKDSHEFNPDRYFGGDRVDQMVIPFGLGRRACPGESLAQAELYLIIANFLLRYEVTADPEHMPSMKAKKELGAVRMPQSYHIHLKKR